MPEYIALKSFRGRYGPVNRGETHTFEADYGVQLCKSGLARQRPMDAAPRNVAHEAAPRVSEAAPKKADGPNDTAAPPVDGTATPLSASRPARRSRRRTVTTPAAKPASS